MSAFERRDAVGYVLALPFFAVAYGAIVVFEVAVDAMERLDAWVERARTDGPSRKQGRS